jgi:hypothetical protein
MIPVRQTASHVVFTDESERTVAVPKALFPEEMNIDLAMIHVTIEIEEGIEVATTTVAEAIG